MKMDGHVHTPFCPHGTKDDFEDYINRAIQLGYEEISFTEHAPLPIGFTDPTPNSDSGMDASLLEDYFLTLSILKKRFERDIKINIGLEVDFIEGFEEETTTFLNEYGPILDDSILSVHFLKKGTQYYCVDYSPDMFNQMIKDYSSINHIYDAYYDTLLQSITSDLGKYKPKRIGHITLVHKFQKKYQPTSSFTNNILSILDQIAENELMLDYNGAGINKPLCKEPYPPNWVIEEAIKRKIPLIYGSDAHRSKDLNQGYESLLLREILTSPTK
ncbi:histidinol-phosphatase HisJ [Fredinandcohnia quinoae]|uniref:Histidinol-phosphatase n=1 Tax=Fredinandcohnia quinoae TaxID=2918902 RepID=A0AAW5EDP9_9BACI|nr:histidinol-phosphatase HisJ [Fredinandcohnia sp. SECRCQ15]MCH1627581.1 histidinol-phosphatase HisJ [Fredinandcohnia sp. SECRCQ15]